MKEKIRTFIALELPDEVIKHIQSLQKWLDIDGKKTKPEHLHLTLKFLGEITPEKLEKVKKRLKKVNIKKLNAKLGKTGHFNKKIIWLGVLGANPLQRAIDDALEGLFKREKRFMGHITIGRAKEIRRIPYNKKQLPFKIKAFYLRKSTLTPEGPIYENLEKYELK
jgi:2'-5' RNA ligase